MDTTQTLNANTVAQRLTALAQLYKQGQASQRVERTLNKLLEYEAAECRTQLGQLQNDMAGFEQQYGMTSAEFYLQFQAGQTDDRMDYVEWASLVQMADNLRARLHLLTDQE
ncbi:MAG: hypothetical protein JW850_09710 [Thermoflexales bacterium]|nr:hypothetical protein [Thermoflexales bacterium]